MSSLVFCPPRDAASAARWARRTVLGWHRCETVAPLSYGNYLDAETLARCGPEWTALYRAVAESRRQGGDARVVVHDPEELMAKDGQRREPTDEWETAGAMSRREESESREALLEGFRAGLQLMKGDSVGNRAAAEMVLATTGMIPAELILEMESTGHAVPDPGGHRVSPEAVEMLNGLLTGRIFTSWGDTQRVWGFESWREINEALSPVSKEAGEQLVLVVEIGGGIPVAAVGRAIEDYLRDFYLYGGLGDDLWDFGFLLFKDRNYSGGSQSSGEEPLETRLRLAGLHVSDRNNSIGSKLANYELPRADEPVTLLVHVKSPDEFLKVARGRTHWETPVIIGWLCGGACGCGGRAEPVEELWHDRCPENPLKMSLQWFTRKPPAVWGDGVSVAILFEGGAEDGPSAGLFLDGP